MIQKTWFFYLMLGYDDGVSIGEAPIPKPHCKVFGLKRKCFCTCLCLCICILYMFNIRPVYAGFPAAVPPFAGFGRRVRAGRIGAFIVALFFCFQMLQ